MEQKMSTDLSIREIIPLMIGLYSYKLEYQKMQYVYLNFEFKSLSCFDANLTSNKFWNVKSV